MRKTILMAIAGLALSATAAVAQTAPKLAYINSQKLIAEAPGAAEARTTIEKEINKHRADLELAADSLNQQIADFQKKQLAMGKEARDKEEASIRAKRQALATRESSLEEQVQKRQNELIKPIMDRINTILTDVRKEAGYIVILDVAGGAIVAADPAADITDQVLARLKATASAAAAAKKP